MIHTPVQLFIASVTSSAGPASMEINESCTRFIQRRRHLDGVRRASREAARAETLAMHTLDLHSANLCQLAARSAVGVCPCVHLRE